MSLFKTKKREEKEKKIKKLLGCVPRKDLVRYLARREDWRDEGEPKSRLVKECLGVGMSLSRAKELRKRAISGFKKPIQANVIRLIKKKWKLSRKLDSEPKCKMALYSLLKDTFGDEPVRKESGAENVDIVINNKIPIELKYNFGRNSYDRLLGQIDRYKEDKNYKKNKIIVVLCRRKNDDGYPMLLKRYKRDARVEIILKEL